MKADLLKQDIGGVVVAIIMILLGVVALWDTLEMTDADSFVFPRAIALFMIGFCILFILLQMTAPSIGNNAEAGSRSRGSTPRRIGLVCSLLLAALLMPWLGFLLSGAVVFGIIMLLAMYDQWTPLRRLVFPLAGIAIVVGFYVMFAKLLQVPLPVVSFFE